MSKVSTGSVSPGSIAQLDLPASGQISLNEIGVEAGQANNSQSGLNDSDIRGLISSATNSQISLADFYGISSVPSVGGAWTNRPELGSKQGDKNVNAVIWTGYGYLVVGDIGRMTDVGYSNDGIGAAWTVSDSKTTGGMTVLVQTDIDQIVGAGTSGNLYYTNINATSPWRPKAGNHVTGMYAIATNALTTSSRGHFIGGSSGFGSNINGSLAVNKNWDFSSKSGNKSCVGLIWADDKYVSIHDDSIGTAMVSNATGTTWTKNSGIRDALSFGTTDLHSIAWNGSMMCAVGYQLSTSVTPSDEYIFVCTSTNGINWTYRPGLKSLMTDMGHHEIQWCEDQWVVVGKGECATSPDGINWTKQPGYATAAGSSKTPRGIASHSGHILVVGDSGLCVSSP